MKSWQTMATGIAMMFVAAAAFAASSYTWSRGSDGNWGDSANWTPAGGPPSAGDTVLFTNVAGNVTLDGARSSGTIVFAPGSAARTLSGAGLSLGNLLRNLSANDQTLTCPLTLSADVLVANYASATKTLILNGPIDTVGHTLRLEARQAITVGEGIGGAGAVIVALPSGGTGKASLRKSSTFTGPLVVAGQAGIEYSGGAVTNTTSVLLSGSGGHLIIGNTGSSIGDDGVTSWGRLANGAPVILHDAKILELIGQNSVNTEERVGPVTYAGSMPVIRVMPGTGGASATLHLASLNRDPETRSLLVVNGGGYTLGNAGRIMLDSAAGVAHIGGNNDRGTDKAVAQGVFTGTELTYAFSAGEQYVNDFVRYDPAAGMVPLDHAADFVNATSLAFPAVSNDGNDNLRIASSALRASDIAVTVPIDGDRVVNSLLLYNNHSSKWWKTITYGQAGNAATLTVKSGMILAAARHAADGHNDIINVATLSFDRVEGMLVSGNSHYGTLTINSAMVGTNGLTTVDRCRNPEETRIRIYGDNRGLTGRITMLGTADWQGQVEVYSRYGLGSGSNELMLNRARLFPRITGSSVTVSSVSGQGTLEKAYNFRMNIGGNGSGGSNDRLTMVAGGALRPGFGDRRATLTVKGAIGVHLNGGTVELDLFGPGQADSLALQDSTSVVLGGASLVPTLHYVPEEGETFLVVSINETTSATGTFAEGDEVTAEYDRHRVTFAIRYDSALAGGSGNDIVLEVTQVQDLAGGTLLLLR